MVKRKDSKPISGSRVEATPSSSLTASPSGGSTPLNVCNTQTTDWYKVHLPFKNPHFKRTFSQSVVISGKKRQWKGLKQIIAQEALEPTQSVSYNSIDAPPSFKPAKKYSDISGLEANYTGINQLFAFNVSHSGVKKSK